MKQNASNFQIINRITTDDPKVNYWPQEANVSALELTYPKTNKSTGKALLPIR